MEDRLLVGALRSRDPDAIGALYDAYADRLYDYCWFRVRNRDVAQVALRDTVMCADARIGELRDPARLGPWLYAIARLECRRRHVPAEPDILVARHDQHDVDLRLIAWRAVTALPPLSQELLDLRHRRDLAPDDIACVIGLPTREVDDLLHQAATLLEAALAAEILAHEDPYECDARAAILRGHRGELDDDLRDRLVAHSRDCAVCARHLPRHVSVAKVCALLPRATPPDLTRLKVTSCFTDPELAGYRLFAAARLPRFGARGFPEQVAAGRAATLGRTPSRWPRALLAMLGALVTAVAAAHAARWLEHGAPRAPVIGAGTGTSPPHLPSPAPLGPPAVGPVAAALPLRSAGPTAPSVALGAPPAVFGPLPVAGWLTATPGRLALAPHTAGDVTLRAVGGPVIWWASVAGPVRVVPASGVLAEGQAATVTVWAPGGGPGGALVAFSPGGAHVTVLWGRPSTPPVSAPPTSAPPTGAPPSPPSPSPTPPSAPPTPRPPTSSPPAPPPQTPPSSPPSRTPSAVSQASGPDPSPARQPGTAPRSRPAPSPAPADS